MKKSFIDHIPPTMTDHYNLTLLEVWLKRDAPHFIQDYRIKNKNLKFWEDVRSRPITISIEDLTEELRRFCEKREIKHDPDPVKDLRQLGLLEDPDFRHKYTRGATYPARLTKRGVKLPPYATLLKLIQI